MSIILKKMEFSRDEEVMCDSFAYSLCKLGVIGLDEFAEFRGTTDDYEFYSRAPWELEDE